LAERNPVAEIQPLTFCPHVRSELWRLDAKDLPLLLRAWTVMWAVSLPGWPLQMMALTFVRTGELIGAKWGDFDALEAAR